MHPLSQTNQLTLTTLLHWQPSAFEDDLSQRRPVDEQVQKTLSLIIEHESLLQNINKVSQIYIILIE